MLLLLGFFLISGLWSLLIPPFESPDEPAHMVYVNFLIKNHRLPQSYEEAPGEAHQPPLYYVLAAGLAASGGLGPAPIHLVKNPRFWWYGGREEPRFVHNPDEFPPLSGSLRTLHVLRIFSVFFGALTILAVFFLARYGGLPRDTAFFAAGLTAFIPQFCFIMGNLNNDAAVSFFSTAALAMMTAALNERQRTIFWILSGLLAGGAILSKLSALALIPAGVLTLVLAAARPRAWAAWLIPVASCSLPIFIRNTIYFGDPLAHQAVLNYFHATVSHKSLLDPFFLREFPRDLFQSFWGLFGWMSFRLPPGYYVAWLLVCLWGFWGLLRLAKRGNLPFGWKVSLLWSFVFFSQLAQIIIYNLDVTQVQGRFLFPVIGVIASVLAVGIRGGFEKIRRPATPIWIHLLLGALALENLWLLIVVVAPAYS